MNRLFLHVCCGPCAGYPLEWLAEQYPALRPELWFYNPNIHPRAEFRRRRDALAYLGSLLGLGIDFSPPYEPEAFMKAVAGAETTLSPPERCRRCYALRLEAAAAEAARRGHRRLASTLAFSRRQNHELLLEEGRRVAARHGLEFFYEDWRSGWKRGHELARTRDLYRQNYCGCVFSEWEA